MSGKKPLKAKREDKTMSFDMDQYENWPARHKHDKKPSEKIIALGKKITDVAAHKLGGVKVSDPEYWGLAEIISVPMAEVALAMKVRTPYTFGELCTLLKVKNGQEERFQKLLDEMSYIGLLEYDYGYHYDHNGRTAPQSERRYILPLFVPGSAELFNMEEKPDHSNPRLEEHPDVASFFERMTYIPLAGITQMVPPGGAGIGMHVIPVEKAISMENQSVDIEHLSYWLKKYEGHIGAGRCSCRASRKVLGDGCADDDYGWCIGVGDFADYCRETGKGHDISYEEAMAILKRAEDNGFVHQITNIDGENKIFGICNCNVNICNALRTSQLFNTPNMSRSAYVAHVDPAKCVACGRCVEYCPAGAVKLGQKLCRKDGSLPEYPKQDLPDAMKWGPDKWDPDYRDHNRINSHESGTAPCKSACPAHIAVQGYIKKAAQGKYQDALALIKLQNPFPAVCGRICSRRCEEECTRKTVDEAVAIDEVKKFIADLDLNEETRFIPEPVIPASIHRDHFDNKIAIIGAGPAGLSAAFFLAKMGYRPTVFEKNEKPGGMLHYGIPSYKLEKDVIDAEIDVIRQMGVDIQTGIEIGKDISIDDLRKQGYEAFFLAIGCSAGALPKVENIDAEGCLSAIDYLHEANQGDQSFEGDVVVIGGGNVAIDSARVSARSDARSVKMYSLESLKEMPASAEEIREAIEDGVIIENGWGVKRIIAEDDPKKVSGIELMRCVSVFDENGRFNPKYDENETRHVKADRIIFAIGQKPVYGELLAGEEVEMEGLKPKADGQTLQSSVSDLFFGGDVLSGPKFAIDAIAAGHEAAESLHRFVQGGHMTTGRNTWQFNMLDKDNLLIIDYDHAGRQEVRSDDFLEKSPFRESKKTFTEEQVRKETARCLQCGQTIVDENRCLGCGICTTKCDFDAITLFRDHPECSTMVRSEDKFKHIIPYQMKRAKKIMVNRAKKKDGK